MDHEGISEPRWIKAAEFKPSYPLGVRVVHHGHVRLEQPDDDFVVRLAGMGVGKRWEILPEGVGKLVQSGPAQIRFSLHYFPVGETVEGRYRRGRRLVPSPGLRAGRGSPKARSGCWSTARSPQGPGHGTSSSRRTAISRWSTPTSWTGR